jgi:hypothetical protein
MAMYGRLAASLAVSGVTMYVLAFSQIDLLDHFELSLSVLWITVSMVSAMGLIMIVAMWPMLPRPRFNVALAAVFALLRAVPSPRAGPRRSWETTRSCAR